MDEIEMKTCPVCGFEPEKAYLIEGHLFERHGLRCIYCGMYKNNITHQCYAPIK